MATVPPATPLRPAPLLRPGARLRLAGVLVLAALLAGCQSQFCTAVGCFSQLVVDLGSAAETFGPGTVSARLCVAGTCSTQDVALGASDARLAGEVPSSVDGGATVAEPVTLRLTRGSTVLLDGAVDAVLTRIAPNGESCGPVCYGGTVFVVDGALRAQR